ncbi:putative nuclease HARBI1 [Merluccius polli]|uniref:Nuclease HARBI1 n=1 Tax=Merluccius polli TaxID=89951 RepID=A0AA47MHB7_MERPO|nr:putative nuclease HARBI1 [Merluccius polli]
MTPFIMTATALEMFYNRKHTETRRGVTERTFGILKMRFSLFDRRAASSTPSVRYAMINTALHLMTIYLDPQEDPKRDFHLSHDAINMLMALLDIKKSHGWEPDLEVLLFLYWLAHGASYSVVSRAFGAPKTSVFRAVHKVAGKIVEKRSHCITLPKPHELEATGAGFDALAQNEAFETCVGAIDGCHIRIKAPAGPASIDYTKRKLFHSIQLQAVCDSGGRFLDTFTGYPGSVHDTRVLKNSPLYINQLYPPAGCFIVVDGGYPCSEQPICLMTPYREPLQSRVQERYNACHSRARSIIERSFGMMKTRWRSIFFKALEVDTNFVPSVITCCLPFLILIFPSLRIVYGIVS